MVRINPCENDSDFACAKQIVKDYILWLDMDLSFQDIDEWIEKPCRVPYELT
jgi:hypothetical protein